MICLLNNSSFDRIVSLSYSGPQITFAQIVPYSAPSSRDLQRMQQSSPCPPPPPLPLSLLFAAVTRWRRHVFEHTHLPNERRRQAERAAHISPSVQTSSAHGDAAALRWMISSIAITCSITAGSAPSIASCNPFFRIGSSDVFTEFSSASTPSRRAISANCTICVIKCDACTSLWNRHFFM